MAAVVVHNASVRVDVILESNKQRALISRFWLVLTVGLLISRTLGSGSGRVLQLLSSCATYAQLGRSLLSYILDSTLMHYFQFENMPIIFDPADISTWVPALQADNDPELGRLVAYKIGRLTLNKLSSSDWRVFLGSGALDAVFDILCDDYVGGFEWGDYGEEDSEGDVSKDGVSEYDYVQKTLVVSVGSRLYSVLFTHLRSPMSWITSCCWPISSHIWPKTPPQVTVHWISKRHSGCAK